jgi:hypothetical protein
MSNPLMTDTTGMTSTLNMPGSSSQGGMLYPDIQLPQNVRPAASAYYNSMYGGMENTFDPYTGQFGQSWSNRALNAGKR